ncbi:MAG TPA: bifunctional pyr operon transcriptional regulator/uracil phosphoribosyltransferase PyrR [Gammaproteobacteria bacterium]|nr:bifunctional pyr operon transcriptional regulator/uracil phosphoribosyltransferase PyrR [Gammaproteobacteria bacterium]
MDEAEIDDVLEALADELVGLLGPDAAQPPGVVGIHTGGFWLAQRLHPRLAARRTVAPEIGTLDISFYRDDFSRIGMQPRVRPSRLPFEVEDREIVLVDDVLYTGRTVRAALNEIFDYGRPASVRLAVLVQRSGRELPVSPDVAGRRCSPGAHEHIKLYGPDPLELHLVGAS